MYRISFPTPALSGSGSKGLRVPKVYTLQPAGSQPPIKAPPVPRDTVFVTMLTVKEWISWFSDC